MATLNKLVTDLIKQFKTNTYGNNCEGQREWLTANGFKWRTTKEEELYVALALAHNDMARRADGHTNEVKVASVEWLYDYFTKNSPFGHKNQADFDKWHDDTCKQFCSHMNHLNQKKHFPKKFNTTYGHAQKVLNMTFKYLYCTASYQAEVEKIDQFLHMTLDSYTLRWYKDQIVAPTKALRAGDISNWSKMNEPSPKHQYIDIQNRIRKFLSQPSPMYEYTIDTEIIGESDPTSDDTDSGAKKKKSKKIPVSLSAHEHPFYAEFVIWQGEIIRAKMESLLSGLNGCYKTFPKDKWAIDSNVKRELKGKMNAILPIL